MSGRQSRHARAVAHAEAERQELWKRGEAGIFAAWWRRLMAWISPKLRRFYLDAVGRWYRRNLKRWSKLAYAQAHDPDVVAMQRAARRIAKARIRKQLARAAKKRSA